MIFLSHDKNVYTFDPIIFASSTNLFEYPHSLSYQPRTFTSVWPFSVLTDVRSASMMQLLESPTKSLRTRGRSSYPKMPINEPMDAFLYAAFTPSTVASFSTI